MSCVKEFSRKWRSENKQKSRYSSQAYYRKNKDKCSYQKAKYHALNPEKRASRNKAWRERLSKEKKENLLAKRREWHRKPQNNIASSLRNILRSSLRNLERSIFIENTIGCSLTQLKDYLASKFKEGMTWDNHGPDGWHIDHIVPCFDFDLTKREEQLRCFHYTNLQPLWAKENRKKGYRRPIFPIDKE